MKRRVTSMPSWGELALSLLCIGLIGVAGGPVMPGLTADHIRASSDALTRYGASHSINDLTAAIKALDGSIDPDTLTPGNFVATRRALVRADVNVLRVVDQSYDPTFNPLDPQNIQFLCVPPPPVVGAHRCMNPDEIKDLAIRATYAASVNLNSEKVKRNIAFRQIAHLDDYATTMLDIILKFLNSIAPDDVGPDCFALDHIVQQAGLSESKRNHIDTIICSRNHPSP